MNKQQKRAERLKRITAIMRNTIAVTQEEAKELHSKGCATIFFMEEHRGIRQSVVAMRERVNAQRRAEVQYLMCN